MSMVWSLESEEEDQQRGEKMLPRNVLSAFIIMLFVYQSTSIFQFHSTVCLTWQRLIKRDMFAWKKTLQLYPLTTAKLLLSVKHVEQIIIRASS